MENRGWVKIYRTILDNPTVCRDSDYLAVWMYLLLNAAHDNYDMEFKGERITLQPGQLITGRKSISAHFNIDESKVQRILKKLEIEQQIEQQTSTKNRLITLLNWNIYQDSEQQIEQQVNNNCTTSEQQMNTNKNVKNANNVNKQTKTTAAKHKFGEFAHVLLKQTESDKLTTELGQETFDKCIKKLDEYIEQKGTKYKNHNLVIHSWVIKAVEEDDIKSKKPNTTKPSTNKFNNFSQRDYDFDELEKSLIGNNG